jgi:hypothetical protein
MLFLVRVINADSQILQTAANVISCTEVLTAVNMQIIALCDVMSCGWEDVYLRSSETSVNAYQITRRPIPEAIHTETVILVFQQLVALYSFTRIYFRFPCNLY